MKVNIKHVTIQIDNLRKQMMKLAIYRCGEIKTKNRKHSHTYTNIGDELLHLNSSLQINEYNIFKEQYPTNNDYDAIIINGSNASILDIEKKAWIKTLKSHIQKLFRDKKTLIGICFGHQIISIALGGQVSKKSCGPHIGIEYIQTHSPKPSYLKNISSLYTAYIHEDKVTKLPEGAVLLGSSDHDLYTFYCIKNQVLSMQFHADYSPHTIKQIYTKMPVLQTITANKLKQLLIPNDYQKILQIILNFIKQTQTA